MCIYLGTKIIQEIRNRFPVGNETMGEEQGLEGIFFTKSTF